MGRLALACTLCQGEGQVILSGLPFLDHTRCGTIAVMNYAIIEQ
jgi:hypothetical protein